MTINTQTQTISSVGITPVLLYIPLLSSGSPPQPAILVNVSSGASLTYTIEVTGDDVHSLSFVNSTTSGNWVPFTGASGLTSSYATTLGAVVTAVRLRVTAYSSGSATIQLVQVTA